MLALKVETTCYKDIFLLFFLFKGRVCVYLCEHMPYVFKSSQRPKEYIRSSGAIVTGANSGPLEEQQSSEL